MVFLCTFHLYLTRNTFLVVVNTAFGWFSWNCATISHLGSWTCLQSFNTLRYCWTVISIMIVINSTPKLHGKRCKNNNNNLKKCILICQFLNHLLYLHLCIGRNWLLFKDIFISSHIFEQVPCCTGMNEYNVKDSLFLPDFVSLHVWQPSPE